MKELQLWNMSSPTRRAARGRKPTDSAGPYARAPSTSPPFSSELRLTGWYLKPTNIVADALSRADDDPHNGLPTLSESRP
eukprot:scaffold23095_cov35-Tisochrysis_lutea.AAC.2